MQMRQKIGFVTYTLRLSRNLHFCMSFNGGFYSNMRKLSGRAKTLGQRNIQPKLRDEESRVSWMITDQEEIDENKLAELNAIER